MAFGHVEEYIMAIHLLYLDEKLSTNVIEKNQDMQKKVILNIIRSICPNKTDTIKMELGYVEEYIIALHLL